MSESIATPLVIMVKLSMLVTSSKLPADPTVSSPSSAFIARFSGSLPNWGTSTWPLVEFGGNTLLLGIPSWRRAGSRLARFALLALLLPFSELSASAVASKSIAKGTANQILWSQQLWIYFKRCKEQEFRNTPEFNGFASASKFGRPLDLTTYT